MPSENFAKVAFVVDDDTREMFNVRVEYLWAEVLGNNRFRLDNIPFYADDAAADDIVEACVHSDDEITGSIDGVPVYLFMRVVEPSGNVTAHVVALAVRNQQIPLEEDPSYQPFIPLCDAIRKSDCIFEGADRPPCYSLAINIPPGADRAWLKAMLGEGVTRKHWVYYISDE